MNYGIISRLDDDTTTAVFKGKRIPRSEEHTSELQSRE